MSASLQEDIKKAVERAACMASMHIRSVPIMETVRGEVAWQGIVEVFALPSEHPARAYGWVVIHEGKTEYVTILGVPPINSPLDAVRAWLASLAKK